MVTALETEPDPPLRWGALLMSIAGLGFIGYGLIFFIRNFTGSFLELGIGEDQVGKSKDEIKAFDPDLYHYISHLHIAIAGFVAAVGLAVIFLAWFGVRRGHAWAWVAAVATPVLALAVALPAHYPWGFATIGHLGLIYLATAIFLVGAVLSGMALRDARRPAAEAMTR
jgi:phosphoglycerol transferase MdoB-like AlkP superfamily enzyme